MRLGLLVLALVPALALAQPDRGRVDRLAQGDIALVAAMTNVSLINLNPTLLGVGARYGATDRTVIGSTVGVFGQASESDTETDGYRADLTVWSETHLAPRGRRVSPFVGVQLAANRQDWTTRTDESCTTCGPIRQRESTYTTVGAGAVGGAELVVLRGLTLSAAMWLGGSYRAGTFRDVQVDGTTITSERTDVTFGTGGTALRLSIYL